MSRVGLGEKTCTICLSFWELSKDFKQRSEKIKIALEKDLAPKWKID